MAISHEPSTAMPERRRSSLRLLPAEMWTSLAISVIWLTVLFDAVFGPDIMTTSSGGSDTARIPSAVVVAFFAYLATHTIARRGFSSTRGDR